MAQRTQGLGEEIANAASHGIGFLLALVSLPALAAGAAIGDATTRHGLLVFIASMLFAYLISALYHAAPPGPAKAWLRRVDHAAIFVFIAGTCTPFALRAGDAPAALALVWTMALLGAALKLRQRLADRGASTGVYVAFGWFALSVIGPLGGDAIAGEMLLWLLVGGAAYSIGTVFFLLDAKLRYAHLVWHLFVLSGSACHVVALTR
jgi:hemolysin III